jgi:CelD/BcsL family acetyltransferase involved in cellulose biosynthesis
MIDEMGYLFFPRRYNYSFDIYMQEFSGKSRKKIGRELAKLEALGLHYRHDCMEDLKHLFRLNQDAYGQRSYFSDCRFLKSFEHLLSLLREKGLLRVTTVVLGGKVAAVDVGAVLGDYYTVLAGGTHPDFPGVAKLINFHHLQWACHQGLEEVDFLSGDFGWKERFHLTPRPLYQLQLLSTIAVQDNNLHDVNIASSV